MLYVYTIILDSRCMMLLLPQTRETVQVYAILEDSPGVRYFGRQSRCTLFCANNAIERNDVRIPNVQAVVDKSKLYAVVLEM